MLSQTTDSASSNNTMAARVFDILANKNGSYSFDWRPEKMHIRCFCHKIALIVNAGLSELGIVAPPPPKIKESILGTFPYPDTMETILEDDEEEPLEDEIEVEDLTPSINDLNEDDNDSEPEHEEEELDKLLEKNCEVDDELIEQTGEYQAKNRNKSNSLDRLTKKV